MIGYLEGTVAAREDDALVLLTAGGVGYRVYVPLPLLAEPPAPHEVLRLHVVTVVRDTEIALFGFARPEGKRLFTLLMKASGIGPRLALNFLSAFRPAELSDAIQRRDEALLTTIPGVGRKTAARLCVELADRIARTPPPAAPGESPQGDLISALTNLGFPEKDVVPVVRQLADEAVPFPDRLRKALGLLGRPSSR